VDGSRRVPCPATGTTARSIAMLIPLLTVKDYVLAARAPSATEKVLGCAA
jgi:hypothetical protein